MIVGWSTKKQHTISWSSSVVKASTFPMENPARKWCLWFSCFIEDIFKQQVHELVCSDNQGVLFLARKIKSDKEQSILIYISTLSDIYKTEISVRDLCLKQREDGRQHNKKLLNYLCHMQLNWRWERIWLVRGRMLQLTSTSWSHSLQPWWTPSSASD